MRRSWRELHAPRVRHIASAWLATLLMTAICHPAVQAAMVPDFTLQLLDGKNTSLQDYRGRSILLNFFHSK